MEYFKWFSKTTCHERGTRNHFSGADSPSLSDGPARANSSSRGLVPGLLSLTGENDPDMKSEQYGSAVNDMKYRAVGLGPVDAPDANRSSCLTAAIKKFNKEVNPS